MEIYNSIKAKDISILNYEEVLAYITFILRAERFSDGSIYNSYIDGELTQLFERLYEFEIGQKY